jgi:hypothetical protein
VQSRRRYTTLSLARSKDCKPLIPNCGLVCRKMDSHLDRRTWNYELFRVRASSLDPSTSRVLSAAATELADIRKNILHTHHLVFELHTKTSATLILFVRHRPHPHDRQTKPSFGLLLICHARRLPPAINPLPHLPQFPSENACYGC